MRRINLIRHGKTDDNHELRYSGSIESRLIWTDEVIKEIILPKLSVEEMGLIYSSPRQRVIETAKPFVNNINDIIIEENIREINFGLYEGLTYDEIHKQYPHEVPKWMEQKNNYAFPEGDSLEIFFQRVVQGFNNIVERSDQDQNITIFTHGGVIQCLITYLLSGSLDLFWNFKVDNCSLTQLYFDEEAVVFERINY